MGDSIFSSISWAMNIVIILTTFYLIFIYIKSPSFRSYPCYYNIILSFVIFIDNVLRLYNAALSGQDIPDGGKGSDDTNLACKIQAFSLSLFDKLMLILLTVNSIHMYIGVVKVSFYQKIAKKFFIMSLILSIAISLALSIIFSFNEDPAKLESICYPKANDTKKIIDTIVTSILFIADSFCTIKLLLHLTKSLKEAKADKFRVSNYNYHFWRIFWSLLIDSFTFFIVLIIINDCFFLNNGDLIDLFYVSTCLLIDLFYTFNNVVIKESRKLFKCPKQEQKEEDEEKFNVLSDKEEKNEGDGENDNKAGDDDE